MRALIIDDERLARVELRRLLQAHPEVEIVGEASDAALAAKCIEQLHPDLLLLDVQMPGASGFDLLDGLEEVPQVIFTTAYDQYALKAFEANALDYLLKPVSSQRLAAALAKLKAPRSQPMERIFIRDGEQCWFLKPGEIRVLESEGNYTRLYFGAKRALVLKTLQAWEDRLPASLFFRASRRHLINLNEIAALSMAPNGNLVAHLSGGEEIEMSKRQSLIFRQRSSV